VSGLRTWSLGVAVVSAVFGAVCVGSAFLGERLLGVEPIFGPLTWRIGKSAFVLTGVALWIHKQRPEEAVEPKPSTRASRPLWRRLFSLSEIQTNSRFDEYRRRSRSA
jgi:hypothetical protein